MLVDVEPPSVAVGSMSVVDGSPDDSGIGPLVPYNGALYYVVFSSLGSTELWKTDGTPAGTAMIRTLPGDRSLQRTTAAVMDGPRSRAIQQGHNRMHAARGLLAFLLGLRP